MKNNDGFTLVEILVVIGIIAILMGVTVGGLMIYVSTARKNTDINNASEIEKSLQFLSSDKDIYSMINNHYPSDGKTGGIICITWFDECSILDASDNSNERGLHKNISNEVIYSKIAELIPKLPESRSDKGFTMIMRVGKRSNGDVVCSAECALGIVNPIYNNDTDTNWESYNLKSLKDAY